MLNLCRHTLIKKGIINTRNILKKDTEKISEEIQKIEFEDETLQEHAIKIREQFIKYMVEKGTKCIAIKNGDDEQVVNKLRSFVSEDDFRKIFEELNIFLKKKALYKWKMDKDEFLTESIDEINSYLKNEVLKNSAEIVTSSAEFSDSGNFSLEKHKTENEEYAREEAEERNDFSIANDIMYHTRLPRLAILKIISGIEKRKMLNSQEKIEKVIQMLLEKLEKAKAENIYEYEIIEKYETDKDEIFAVDKISSEDLDNEKRIFKADRNRKKALNEYYKLDSDGEKEFAHKLENDDRVLLFTKLKKGGFVIDTPYGNYSPDWAVIYRNSDIGDIENIGLYFIVESKTDKKEKNLSEVEKMKIRCGKLHFKAISENIKFNWINSYEDFRKKFSIQ